MDGQWDEAWVSPDPDDLGSRGAFDRAVVLDDELRDLYDLVPNFYVVDESDAVDLDAGARLPLPADATVTSGTTLRATTYGNLLVIDDENGVERVLVVEPNIWFPGHLG